MTHDANVQQVAPAPGSYWRTWVTAVSTAIPVWTGRHYGLVSSCYSSTHTDDQVICFGFYLKALVGLEIMVDETDNSCH
jgi:hypothetical protein